GELYLVGDLATGGVAAREQVLQDERFDFAFGELGCLKRIGLERKKRILLRRFPLGGARHVLNAVEKFIKPLVFLFFRARLLARFNLLGRRSADGSPKVIVSGARFAR